MDLLATLGAGLQQAPLGPAGSFAKAVITPSAPTEVARPAQSGSGGMGVLGALVGIGVGTAMAAGVGYGLGGWMYPNVGGKPFAKVGAVGYLVPVGVWVGLGTVGALAYGSRKS